MSLAAIARVVIPLTLGVLVIVALVLIFIAWKVLMGIVKFGAIVLILAAAAWFLTSGGMG